ncbi:MAG: OmpA family protein [Fimbriimonadaceae bacterium]|nr:OmpA family protein [Fimbriimonadaceae bacterium]
MAEVQPIIIKKKKVVAGGHHGGSWKVAYADFVTAMMAFFMVMWIMGMDSETRSMIQGYFNDPLGFVKNPPKTQTAFSIPGSPKPKEGVAGSKGMSPDTRSTSEKQSAEMQLQKENLESVKTKIEKALSADPELKGLLKYVSLTVTDEGLLVELTEAVGAVFFESGSYAIRPEAMKLISKVGPILSHSGYKIIVKGHTDAMPYAGSGYTNWDLSTDRAQAMRRALSQNGVAEDQFVSVTGLADKELKNTADPNHFSNRRVTLLLPYKKPIGMSEDLSIDAFKQVNQGAFSRDVVIAPN